MEVDDDSLSCTEIDSGEEQEDFISLTDVNSDSDGDVILIGSEDSRHSYKVSDGDVILIGSEDRLIGKVSDGDVILIGSEDRLIGKVSDGP